MSLKHHNTKQDEEKIQPLGKSSTQDLLDLEKPEKSSRNLEENLKLHKKMEEKKSFLHEGNILQARNSFRQVGEIALFRKI